MGRYFCPPSGDAGPNQGQPNPLLAAHYLNVDENPSNDADYIKTVNPNSYEVYGIDADAIPGGETVVNVDVVWRQAGTHASVATAEAGIRIAGVYYPGALRNLQDQSFVTYTEHFPLNPATGQPWTKADVASACLFRRVVSTPQEVGWPRMSQCVAFVDTVEPPPRFVGSGASRAFTGIGYPLPDDEGEGA